MRFYAVLLVMIGHWLQWRWSNPLLTQFHFGSGVIVFFVLSGFLITRILLSNRQQYDDKNQSKGKLLKAFYIRRFLRIFPIYYLLIIALFICDYRNSREIFPWTISYTTNIYQAVTGQLIGYYNHFWSLAVEEQFYLFWPFLILFVNRRFLVPAIIFTIVASLASKLCFFLYIGQWMATSYFTSNCLYTLAAGALLACIAQNRTDLFKRLGNPVWLIAAVLTHSAFWLINLEKHSMLYTEVIDEALFAVDSFFFIAIAARNGFRSIFRFLLENRLVRTCGRISYGLYVYHLFMYDLYLYLVGRSGIEIGNKYVDFVLEFAMTFVLAWLSWKLIESPANKLKKRIPYFSPRPG